MPQINDAIDAAIAPSGIANQSNDEQLRNYQANGATAGAINDAARQFLAARGETAAQINDAWGHYLVATKGFAGAINDVKMIYWGTGPRP